MGRLVHVIWECLQKRLRPLGDQKATAPWTAAVMKGLVDTKDALARTCGIPAGSLHCFHHCRDAGGAGEYMLDFAWTTLPDGFSFPPGPKPQAPYEILLAAESEWGKARSPSATYRAVLDDFCKLVDIKARTKVMVYGCHIGVGKSPDAGDIRDGFQRVLANHRNYDPQEEWLFVGIPWDAAWEPQVHAVDALPAIRELAND
jgi:hypothetical protein